MIYALHGFLGLPSDWDNLDLPKKAIDIFSFGTPSADFSLQDWAKSFNQIISATTPHLNNILLGYSLGGRLAMHALVDNPSLWKGAVLVSAHPGLPDTQQKKIRLEQDEAWAQRFENEPWDPLMTSWNSLPIFAKSQKIFRKETDYNRNQLANTMRFWSLAHQDNLIPALSQFKMPLQYIVGECDKAYSTLAGNLSHTLPKAKIWIAPKTGHRVPWDSPESFNKKVNQFIRNN